MTILLGTFFLFIFAASEASVLVMYRVVLGICLSVIAILLVVVLILTTYAIHLYRHRFKRRPGERNFIL